MPTRETDPNELFEKFRKRNTPEFYGNEDPMLADDFLVQMEKIFAVFKCTKVQEVQLIAYMFRGVADIWWTTIKTIYDTMAEDTTWTAFSKEFDEKFIPTHVKTLKMREFKRLLHGQLTVQSRVSVHKFVPVFPVPDHPRL